MNAARPKQGMTEVDVNILNDLFRYDPLTGILFWARNRGKMKAGSVAGTITAQGRVQVWANGRFLLRHRIAWAMTHGEWPKDEIDHINGVEGDDRIENLRNATRSQNACNRGIASHNQSGFKGVVTDKRRGTYEARIAKGGKIVWRKPFRDPAEAAAAYAVAVKQYHGEFARC